MIKTETIQTAEGSFIRTYSDQRYYIRGGVPEGLYEDAIDPIDAGRVYVETDTPIPDIEGEDATEEDYQEALTEFGVTFDEEN